MLRKYCEVYKLETRDYRRSSCILTNEVQRYVSDRKKLWLLFLNCNEKELEKDRKLEITNTRHITIPFLKGKCAWFNFNHLCGGQGIKQSLDTKSFIKLATNFNTIYIAEVPQLNATVPYHDPTRSLVLLVDVLYEYGIECFMNSNIPLLQLFGEFGQIQVEFCIVFSM